VSGALVVPLETANAAALGAALRAWHADRLATDPDIRWDDIVSPFVRVAPPGPVRPRPELRTAYDELMRAQAAFEAASRSTP
jgi:hypothetical protein